MAEITPSELLGFRRRVAEALDPELRREPGLSRTNIAIIGLIIFSIVVGILETEQTIAADGRVLFTVLESAIFCLFLIEYVARIWSSIETPAMPAGGTTPSSPRRSSTWRR